MTHIPHKLFYGVIAESDLPFPGRDPGTVVRRRFRGDTPVVIVTVTKAVLYSNSQASTATCVTTAKALTIHREGLATFTDALPQYLLVFISGKLTCDT